jgi:hypothetical protein
MQTIIILKDVEMPDTPRFDKGQKVRVADTIADILVERGFAQYDQGEEAVTEKAKEMKVEKPKKVKK